MALPDEGYFICAETGDDGAAILTDGVVKRGVRVFMRAIASMGESARFHANNFESVALKTLSKELKQPDGGARIKKEFGDAFYNTIKKVRDGVEPLVIPEDTVEQAVAEALERDEFPSSAFTDRALRDGSHKGEALMQAVAHQLEHTDGGELLELEFGDAIREMVYNRARAEAHKEFSALKRPRKARVFMAVAERPHLEKRGMSPGEIGAPRRPGAVFTRDDAFPQAGSSARRGTT
jgi:hypothetical protein